MKILPNKYIILNYSTVNVFHLKIDMQTQMYV